MNDPLEVYFKPIGQLVVSFGELEVTVGAMLASMAKLDTHVGLAITAEMSFGKKLDALKSVTPFVVKDEMLRSEIDGLVKKLSACEEKRNTVIHSLWVPNRATEEVGRWKATAKRGKGLKFGRVDASIDEIQEAIDAIAAASKHAADLWTRLQKCGIAKGPLNP